EHAAWALQGFGIKAVLAPLFADIFRNNALKNGLLPVELSAEVHFELAAAVEADPDAEVTVDLEAETVTLPGGRVAGFQVDPFARQMLLDGTDELGYLLAQGGAGGADEDAHPPRRGWLRRCRPPWSWFPPARSPCAWPPRPARASPTGPCSAPPWPTAPAACTAPQQATTPWPWPSPWPSWARGSTWEGRGRRSGRVG